MDRSMMIWEPDESSGVWINKSRMGEFGGLSGLFGQLGYFSARFSKDGTFLMGTGYNGSFHLWNLKENKPLVSITGHFSDVMDVAWDPKFNYFVSTSLDQTTRLFSKNKQDQLWYEISRPQIHGYDLICLDFIKNKEHKFITGGNDEKVFRIFEAPSEFLKKLKNISNIETEDIEERPEKATYSQLGLSNKAILKEEGDELNSKEEGLPFEEDLLQNTLWPETQKLYGHSNEIMSVTCSNNGNVIATCCKSKTKEYSTILIWGTKDWKIINELKGHHNLTITRIEFSHDDEFMASVSRDRKIILYKKDEKEGYKHFKEIEEAHERIIWDCSFSKDGQYLVTGSRDMKIKIWSTLNLELKHELLFKSPVTSVAFLPLEGLNLIAIGCENGSIQLFHFGKEKELIYPVSKNLLPCETISRIRWKVNHEKSFNLLVSSHDHSVRVYNVEME
jgi:elongator complex protein 2